jgi:hypothetical protein
MRIASLHSSKIVFRLQFSVTVTENTAMKKCFHCSWKPNLCADPELSDDCHDLNMVASLIDVDWWLSVASPPKAPGWHPRNITVPFLRKSSSSCSYQGVGPLVDPFRSHASRCLWNGLLWFLLPFWCSSFVSVGNLLRGIRFNVVSIFSYDHVFCLKLALHLIPLRFLYLFCDLSKFIQLFFSYIFSLLLLLLLHLLL